jgi:hypothetical protein
MWDAYVTYLQTPDFTYFAKGRNENSALSVFVFCYLVHEIVKLKNEMGILYRTNAKLLVLKGCCG